jgi:hypothetical protein
MTITIKTWQERMPAPRPAFECTMNCSSVGMCAVLEDGCGDCRPITLSGDPAKARDEEIAELRNALGSVRNTVLEEAAVEAERQDRAGREWVLNSVWDNIIKRVPNAIRALKDMQ